MPVRMTLNKGRVPVKVFTHDIEHDALQQLLNVASLPIVFDRIVAKRDATNERSLRCEEFADSFSFDDLHHARAGVSSETT